MKNLINHDSLIELLNYDQYTGCFTWRQPVGNKRKSRTQAGNLEGLGLIIDRPFGNDMITVLSYTFKNNIMLSESLRDELSYQYAVECLEAFNIPHNSLLWTLGHKGGDSHWKVS